MVVIKTITKMTPLKTGFVILDFDGLSFEEKVH